MGTAVGEKKNTRLVARVSATNKRLLEKAAALEGRTLANFVVSHAIATAESVVRRQNLIRLNEEQSERFLKALLDPKPPTAALKKAMREHTQRVTQT